MKFEKPEGMGEHCVWFPVNSNLPNTHLDYSGTVILGNIAGQLFCSFVLLFLGCLGDFGNLRYKGLVLAWIITWLCPTGEEILSLSTPGARGMNKRRTSG